eukprot:904615-Lingulodinium_polyedra.AAC.1
MLCEGDLEASTRASLEFADTLLDSSREKPSKLQFLLDHENAMKVLVGFPALCDWKSFAQLHKGATAFSLTAKSLWDLFGELHSCGVKAVPNVLVAGLFNDFAKRHNDEWCRPLFLEFATLRLGIETGE